MFGKHVVMAEKGATNGSDKGMNGYGITTGLWSRRP